MAKQRFRLWRLVVALALLVSVGTLGHVGADQSTSSHYMVNETQFGSGSSLEGCSSSYCAKTSAGDTTVGTAKSDNYSAQFGFNTSDVPVLEVITLAGDQDMGLLDPDTTGTATATIKVRNYLSSGYVIQLTGHAPGQGTHVLKTMSTDCPCTSQPGAEQFGVNLAANTAPSIGSNPLQVPSGSFSYGAAADDYATPNLFKYVDGDIIASSTTSSGQTEYTLSMIINVSAATPGGRYNGGFSAVVVPTY